MTYNLKWREYKIDTVAFSFVFDVTKNFKKNYKTFWELNKFTHSLSKKCKKAVSGPLGANPNEPTHRAIGRGRHHTTNGTTCYAFIFLQPFTTCVYPILCDTVKRKVRFYIFFTIEKIEINYSQFT